MRKITGILTFLISACTGLVAQTADVTWSDPTPFSRQSYYSKIAEETKDAFYVLKTSVTGISSNDILLEKYSKSDLSLETSFTIYTETMYAKTPGAKRPLDYDKLMMMPDGFVVFFTEFLLEAKTFTSYAQKFDAQGQRVGELQTLEVFTGNDKTVIGKYEFTPSPFGDGFILCYSRPFILYSDEYFRFKFYDYNLQEKWEKEFLFPFKGKEFEIRQIKASVDSTVYMMIKVLEDDEKEREKKGNRNITYTYNMLSFTMDPADTSGQFSSMPLTVGKKYITDVSFGLNDHMEIACAGYFADRKDMAISGAFYMVIESKSTKVRTSSTMDFSKEFLARFVDTKNPDRGVGMRDFELQDLQIRNDGTVYLIGEQVFGKTVCYGQPPKLKCNTENYFNDIVVTRISNEGKIEWTSNVPKRSFDEENGFLLSYAYKIMDNKIVFIYNDSPKNMNTFNPLELKYVSTGGMVSMVAEVNNKGEVHRELMHEDSDTKILLRPRTYLQLGNELVIYGIKGNKQYWGKVRFY